MLFSSHIYLCLFLPLVCAVFYYLKRKQKQAFYSYIWLFFVSLCFYAFWKLEYLWIIVCSIFFNYLVSKYLSRGANRKLVLIFGLTCNIGLLCYFKYLGFGAKIINKLFSQDLPIIEFVLPLGISFFTLQQVAYLVDTYRGIVKEQGFVQYGLFVTFFPQLIAGPIVHHSEMMPQFDANKKVYINYENFFKGVAFILIGLVKKVVIADYFAIDSDWGHGHISDLNFWTAWITSLSYSMQIYFDFSGYSDMAIGSGLLFNIHIPYNFNSPYKAKSIQDFWRRWHITLSRFLKDYLYISFGGSRRGLGRTCLALFLTFLIGGIWHGAGMTFVIWGILHGVATIVHRLWLEKKYTFSKLWGTVLTLLYVNIAWIYFRAESTNSAEKIIKLMHGKLRIEPFDSDYIVKFIWIILAIVGCLTLKNSQEIVRDFSEKKFFKNLKIFPFFKRLPFYMIAVHTLIIIFAFNIYKSDWDKKTYQLLPFKTDQMNVANDRDDLRANIWKNQLAVDPRRKVVIVGSSFTMHFPLMKFKNAGEEMISGTIGMGGNTLVNGARLAMAATEFPKVDTIILGVTPLNFGLFKPEEPFPKEGIDAINLLGFDFKGDRYGKLFKQNLDAIDFLDLYVNFSKLNQYYQLSGFLNNIKERLFRESRNDGVMSVEISSSARATLENKIFEMKRNVSLPVANPQNGVDRNFHWTERNILQSLKLGGDGCKVLSSLKKYLSARKIRFIVYDTPTPDSSSEPQIYPEGFLGQYLAQMKMCTDSAGISYYNLTNLFPYKGEFMQDFVHLNQHSYELMHEYLLQRSF